MYGKSDHNSEAIRESLTNYPNKDIDESNEAITKYIKLTCNKDEKLTEETKAMVKIRRKMSEKY